MEAEDGRVHECEGVRGCGGRGLAIMLETSFLSSLISARRDSSFVEGGVMAEMWGGTMSITLSVKCALSSRLFPGMDNKITSPTLAGILWRKSSRSSAKFMQSSLCTAP